MELKLGSRVLGQGLVVGLEEFKSSGVPDSLVLFSIKNS